MAPKPKILVAPLDWGLGHATRCVPIIKSLLEKNCEVIIGADRKPLALLRKEFPQLEYVVMPGYEISYPSKGFMAGHLFALLPKIKRGIQNEHTLLNKLINEKNIDVVISDNRYGLYNKNITSVFITHQLFIQAPLFSSLIKKINFSYINKFNECWVPDYEGSINLSGNLSHLQMPPANTFYIGPLTRFTNELKATEKNIDLLCILSGPEPQRSIFEKIVLDQLKNSDQRIVIIQGDPESNTRTKLSANVELISHVNAEKLNQLLLSAKLVLCRSGYSSIMDIAALGKKAIFVPTPGQTEQEYLADKFKKEKVVYSVSQNKFNLKDAIAESLNYKGFSIVQDDTMVLEERIKKLMRN